MVPPRTIGPPVIGSPLCVLFVDFAEALADPLNYLGKLGKHKKQLEVFFPEDEETEQVSGGPLAQPHKAKNMNGWS